MKTFLTILKDIRSLEGRLLQSIRPGADITVVKVLDEEQRVEVRTLDNKLRSRKFGELELIFKALLRDGVVHVDRVLGGSGSSRNQPETIFANLPYVEWLNLGRKKHICLRSHDTHELGTLKEMDPIEARRLVDALTRQKQTIPSSVIITDRLKETLDYMKRSGGDVEAIAAGAYGVKLYGAMTWVVQHSVVQGMNIGGYVVCRGENAVLAGRLELSGLTVSLSPLPGVVLSCPTEQDE